MGRVQVDLIIRNAGQLLTLGGYDSKRRTGKAMSDLGVVINGSVAVKEGKILLAAPNGEIEEKFELMQNGIEIDAAGKTVMPGLVDCHTHVLVYGAREDEYIQKIAGVGAGETDPLDNGIYRSVRQTRAASAAELAKSVKKTLNSMLLHGTTTVDARTSYGLGMEYDITALKVAQTLDRTHPMDLVPTYQGAHTISPEYLDDPDGYVDVIVGQVLPEIGKQDLAKLCDVGCEDGGIDGCFTVEQSRRILLEARRQGLIPRVGSELTPGGVRLAIEIGAVSVEHASAVPLDLIRELAAKNIGANMLPASELAAMKGRFTDARPFIDNGVPVAIGTNFNPGSYCESMLLAIWLACTGNKMAPEEAVVGATINASHVLNVHDRVGSLEPGKQADILVLDIPNYYHLAYHFGVNLVDMVVKAGKVVVESGRLTI
ncbi:MAG: imidazolonepropionase [Anaerolineales bacterium]|nr:imidazolonepropionase [Anaerolineales bacterium]